MKNIYSLKAIIAVLLLFVSINQVYASATIKISDGYIKASIPGSDVTAAYMKITNISDRTITLEKITSAISDQIEMHKHSMAGGMMRMRQVDNISVDANSSITLQPSGLHLMIFSLKQQLSENDNIMLTMHFSDKTKIDIQLPVYRYK
ncbi:copper chaperone PCu(A)C [Colwelliaceae bacterium MEBiC 14330]